MPDPLFPSAARRHDLSRRLSVLLALVLGSVLAATPSVASSATAPDTVVVQSGSLHLRGVLYRPDGTGPFPAILFNHGSGHSHQSVMADQRHPEILGPLFARHGYVFLHLYRRGDGLSADQGVPSGDVMDGELAKRGIAARNRIQMRLLETDELQDARAGLAFLRALPDVDRHRVAVVGHSFGGSLTLLLADGDPTLRAAVAFAPAGGSWDRSPALRARLLKVARRTSVPIFLVDAENDISTSAEKVLGAERERLGRPWRVKIYPPHGNTAEEGHSFVYFGVSEWEPDVFPFLDQLTKGAREASSKEKP
jgi:dienelactone hydrolase